MVADGRFSRCAVLVGKVTKPCVLGNVIDGDYQLCLSFWLNTADRIGLFDFVVMGKTINWVLAFIPKLPPFDPYLFLRPFRHEVWVVVGMAGAFISIFLISSTLLLGDVKRKTHLRIAISVWWISYVMIR